jgi:signal transduction histidine kinase
MTMEPLEKTESSVDPELLFEAFQKFSETSSVLEKSYQELQKKVSELNLELEEKNRSLAETLDESERIGAHLSTVLSSMRDGVMAYDLQGDVTLANEAASALLDMDRKSLIGKNMKEAMISAFSFLPEALKDGQTQPCECHLKRGEESFVYKIGHHPLEDGREQAIGGIITLEDITHTTFARQQSERNERLAAMGKMAVNIVHEIRNPMGSIELMASLLRRDLNEDLPKKELADRICTGIHSLNHIIENLLTFARDRKPAMESADINGLIDESLSVIEPMVKRNRIVVSTNLDQQTRMIHCDRDLMKQALVNLMLNAVQAMGGGGELQVTSNRRDLQDFTTGKPNRFIQLRIADTGHGMPPDVKARIFDPFFTTKEQGTGLGLALLHKIIRAHGGFVGVDSSPGQGTIFTMMIPLGSAKEQSDE